MDFNDYLEPGEQLLTFDQFIERFVYNERREILCEGLRRLMQDMECVYCNAFYIGGSFVRGVIEPGDIDACWIVPKDITGEKLASLFPIIASPKAVKEEYNVHLFTVFQRQQDLGHNTWLDMLKLNRHDEPIGIIKIEF